MQYRRALVRGGTYFFTVVVFARAKILATPEHIQLLRASFAHVMSRHPFQIDAIVILPDHLHCIWTLPENDCDYSNRWRMIKAYFTRYCNPKWKRKPSASRKNKNEQALWQRRFWEHLITDECDFARHVDYIHYNPVKHGYVDSPGDWAYSSFQKYVRNGKYSLSWGSDPELNFDLPAGGE